MRNDSPCRLFAIVLLTLAGPTFALAQASSPQAQPTARVRITQTIDENQLTELHGNTHPLAKVEFDRGVAPLSMTLHRMLLVLNRAPEQEAALQRFLVDLYDKSSPNYQKWLTPAQFGQQFGPADEDLQIITSWLRSHGFQVARVTNGRGLVEFSGTVAQVREAFHTEIHRYIINGEEHWANSSDPQIPSALTPLVGGVATLHNFLKHTNLASMSHYAYVQRGPKGGVDFCTVNQSPCPSNDVVHALGPGDLSTIYNAPNSLNVNPPPVVINGDAIKVGVVGRSNINLSDIQTFRSLFSLGGIFTQNNIVLDGPDPGDLGGLEEIEAILDTSWAGAAAPNATIEFVVSQSTETTDGVDLSEAFIIDNNLADVMTESFGICEQDAGQALANAEVAISEQAAAQGITFLASSDDSGAVCSSGSTETIATEIPASLPFVTAVGGTMFIANDKAFWSSTNNQITLESALKYIPEKVWNETFPGGSQGAGGGGASTLYKAPSWQTGVTGLSGSMRQVPDVSLNAAAGHDPFIICVADQGASCSTGGSVLLVGGTSASAPSFAGIMALVVESQTNERQGQAGYVLYDLASAEMNSPGTLAACNSTGASPPASTCVFNDITTGNNVFAGEVGSTSDFQAGPGYDLASGLGSVNVANLIGTWKTAGTTRGTSSSTTLTSTTAFPITHGSPASFAITVAPQTGAGTPTGDVSVIVSPTGSTAGTLPGGIELATFALANGSVTSSTSTLPGGTYSLTAHYEGDGTFLPSDSSPFGPITVSQESSQTQVQLVLLNPSTGAITFPTTLPYGSNDAIRVNVTSTNSSAPCAKNALGNFGCPTGTVTINKNTGSPLDGGTFTLNSLGYTEDQAISATLAPGSYNVQASYSGDISFIVSSGSEAVTITPASTTAVLSASPTNISATASTSLTANISTQSFGNPPTGNVTFALNSGAQLGTAPVSGSFNSNTGFAQGTTVLNVSASQLQSGSNSITATYNGDANYAASPVSSAITVTVSGGASGSFNLALTPSTVMIASPGTSGQATLSVTAVNGFSGTISLNSSVCSGLPAESSCSFSSTSITGSGSSILTIMTTSPSAVAPHGRPRSFGPWTPLASITLALLLGAALLIRFQPNRRRLAITFGLVTAVSLLAMGACGGGGGSNVVSNPGTPVGNYANAVITLTSGSVSNSIKFSVNVQ
jgi:subtilase family serine protease